MRLSVIVFLALALPVTARAQSTLAPVPPLPPIGLPLPEITSPLTPVALTGAAPYPPAHAPRPPLRDFKRRSHRNGTSVFYVPVFYPYPVVMEAPFPGLTATAPSTIAPEPESGPAEPQRALRAATSEDRPPQVEGEDLVPPPPSAPAPPSTFYFIPGCYIGNVPPSQVVLPPGCDRTRVVTRTSDSRK